MTHILELSKKSYEKLQQMAERSGLTPSEYLEAALSREPADLPTLKAFSSVAEALAPYIVSVDSRTHRPDPKYRSKFGDLVDEKMTRQGFKRPGW